MRPKNSEKRRNSERSNREAEKLEKPTNEPFDPFPFEAKDPKTALLLLQSKERSVLLAAVEALSRYAGKSTDNVNTLFDLGLVNGLLSIIRHEDLFVRRFAAKLLTEMVASSDVVTARLIESDQLSHLAHLLTNETDAFMQEYFSAILAKSTKDPYGAAHLATRCPDANFLFEGMRSPDPDVQRNNMEILYNLTQDPVGAQKIPRSQKFNFSLLYEAFESPYPEIQCLALNTVADIIGRNRDEDVQSSFRETNGLKAILNFLENDEWNDLHVEALRALNLAVENSVIANELVDVGSVPQILNYVERATSPELFAEALRIVVRVANTSNGRKVLHSCEIVERLTDALRRSAPSDDAVEISCHGIGKMALHYAAAKELAGRQELVETILGFLKREDLRWSARRAAAFALRQLLASDPVNCNILLNIHGQDYLLHLVKQEVPIELRIIALEALIVIARHPTLRGALIDLDTVDTIYLLLGSTCPLTDELKIACCDLLSALCSEEDGRRRFLESNGPERLHPLITDAHSAPVRNAAVQLIQTMSTDLIAASAFVESKCLQYMLNNRSSAGAIPAWNACIETLFRAHLPIKFALTGRLSLRDVTRDGFYVLRRSVCPFPALDDIFRFKFCPLEPIYVINFKRPPTDTSQSEIVFEEAGRSAKGHEKGIFLSAENINAWLELKHGRLQYDPDLVEYVERFKRMLLATEPKDDAFSGNGTVRIVDSARAADVAYVRSRAQMLARFVARQMSGLDPAGRCVHRQLEVHLKEIRQCLGTSVIPLGRLRAGAHLERALLFKAMADRICLPAALVRGEYGVSWIEIALPKIEDRSSDDGSFGDYRRRVVTAASLDSPDDAPIAREHGQEGGTPQRSTVYPVGLARPNFIVDLMDVPGDLIPIGSPRAKLYRAAKRTCDTIRCR